MGKAKKTKFKLSKESVMIVVALSVIALVAALVLSLVNMFTYVSESEAIERALGKSNIEIAKSYEISDFGKLESLKDSEILYIGKSKDDGRVFITKALKTKDSCYNAEGISLIVVIKNDIIQSVHAYKHAETPGLGSKALEAEYLNQYKGKNVNNFRVTSDPAIDSPDSPGDVQFSKVTSATYSSVGVNVAVKSAVKAYKDTKDSMEWN